MRDASPFLLLSFVVPNFRFPQSNVGFRRSLQLSDSPADEANAVETAVRLFATMDGDKDGVVTWDEFNTYVANLAKAPTLIPIDPGVSAPDIPVIFL